MLIGLHETATVQKKCNFRERTSSRPNLRGLGVWGDVIRPEGLRVLGLQLLDPAAVTGERGERDVSQNTPGEVVQMSWAVVKLVW